MAESADQNNLAGGLPPCQNTIEQKGRSNISTAAPPELSFFFFFSPDGLNEKKTSSVYQALGSQPALMGLIFSYEHWL